MMKTRVGTVFRCGANKLVSKKLGVSIRFGDGRLCARNHLAFSAAQRTAFFLVSGFRKKLGAACFGIALLAWMFRFTLMLFSSLFTRLGERATSMPASKWRCKIWNDHKRRRSWRKRRIWFFFLLAFLHSRRYHFLVMRSARSAVSRQLRRYTPLLLPPRTTYCLLPTSILPTVDSYFIKSP